MWVLVNHLGIQCEYLLIIWTSETCKTERFKPTAIQILNSKPHILHHSSFFPSDAPKNTSLSAFPSSSVMEGKPVNLTCRTDANPAELNYTWYRETGSQFELLQTGYNHTYIVTNSTYGAWYGCNAQNLHGQRNATIQLDVQCEYKDKPQINLIW